MDPDTQTRSLGFRRQAPPCQDPSRTSGLPATLNWDSHQSWAFFPQEREARMGSFLTWSKNRQRV